MKIYKVKVNGKIYQVELESVKENNQSIQSENNQKSNQVDDGHTVNAPMQGTILAIHVNMGQSVKKGDSLLVLEAMKLENEITADRNGVIKDILVNIGDTVDNNQPLISVE